MFQIIYAGICWQKKTAKSMSIGGWKKEMLVLSTCYKLSLSTGDVNIMVPFSYCFAQQWSSWFLTDVSICYPYLKGCVE